MFGLLLEGEMLKSARFGLGVLKQLFSPKSRMLANRYNSTFYHRVRAPGPPQLLGQGDTAQAAARHFVDIDPQTFSNASRLVYPTYKRLDSPMVRSTLLRHGQTAARNRNIALGTAAVGVPAAGIAGYQASKALKQPTPSSKPTPTPEPKATPAAKPEATPPAPKVEPPPATKPEAPTEQAAESGLPGWAIPAGIGTAGLLWLLNEYRKRRKQKDKQAMAIGLFFNDPKLAALTRSAVGESGLSLRIAPWSLQGEDAWPTPSEYGEGGRKDSILPPGMEGTDVKPIENTMKQGLALAPSFSRQGKGKPDGKFPMGHTFQGSKTKAAEDEPYYLFGGDGTEPGLDDINSRIGDWAAKSPARTGSHLQAEAPGIMGELVGGLAQGIGIPAAIGSGIGAVRAPSGSRGEGALRGATRGAGTGAGAMLGGGTAALLSQLLANQVGGGNVGLSPGIHALAMLPGLLAGGYGGYKLTGGLLGKPSWESEDKETKTAQELIRVADALPNDSNYAQEMRKVAELVAAGKELEDALVAVKNITYKHAAYMAHVWRERLQNEEGSLKVAEVHPLRPVNEDPDFAATMAANSQEAEMSSEELEDRTEEILEDATKCGGLIVPYAYMADPFEKEAGGLGKLFGAIKGIGQGGRIASTMNKARQAATAARGVGKGLGRAGAARRAATSGSHLLSPGGAAKGTSALGKVKGLLGGGRRASSGASSTAQYLNQAAKPGALGKAKNVVTQGAARIGQSRAGKALKHPMVRGPLVHGGIGAATGAASDYMRETDIPEGESWGQWLARPFRGRRDLVDPDYTHVPNSAIFGGAGLLSGLLSGTGARFGNPAGNRLQRGLAASQGPLTQTALGMGVYGLANQAVPAAERALYNMAGAPNGAGQIEQYLQNPEVQPFAPFFVDENGKLDYDGMAGRFRQAMRDPEYFQQIAPEAFGMLQQGGFEALKPLLSEALPLLDKAMPDVMRNPDGSPRSIESVEDLVDVFAAVGEKMQGQGGGDLMAAMISGQDPEQLAQALGQMAETEEGQAMLQQVIQSPEGKKLVQKVMGESGGATMVLDGIMGSFLGDFWTNMTGTQKMFMGLAVGGGILGMLGTLMGSGATGGIGLLAGLLFGGMALFGDDIMGGVKGLMGGVKGLFGGGEEKKGPGVAAAEGNEAQAVQPIPSVHYGPPVQPQPIPNHSGPPVQPQPIPNAMPGPGTGLLPMPG